MPKALSFAFLLVLAPASLAAQQAADTLDYVVLRGADTVATERVWRDDVTFRGELTVRGLLNRLTQWSVVLGPDGAAALVEANETEAPNDPRMKARVLHRTRVIFKADSASLDDATGKGMLTNIYPTKTGAVPYLNLSAGTLEVAVRKGLVGGEVPLFNLGGAQTVVATVTKTGEGSATLQVGSITYQVTYDTEGRLVEATLPAQQLRMMRR